MIRAWRSPGLTRVARLMRTAAFSLAVGAMPALAQNQPGGAPAGAAAGMPAAIEGIVREVFLNRIILESEGKRLLVEPLGRGKPFAVQPGDALTIRGNRFDSLVQADRISRSNGELIHESAASQTSAVGLPQAGAPATPADAPRAAGSIGDILSGLGLSPLGEAVRKRHHTEILARMTDGRSVYVSFDLSGRLWEIEDAAYDKERAADRSAPSDGELFRLAREAGFSPSGPVERRRHHAEVAALNRAGEAIVLHIGRDGYIYKQVWRR